MVTFQAGRAALIALFACLAAACSREQQDWRSAESANSPEGWQRFLEQHPESELAGRARTRITELEVQRDFQRADRIGTMDAYRNFIAGGSCHLQPLGCACAAPCDLRGACVRDGWGQRQRPGAAT